MHRLFTWYMNIGELQLNNLNIDKFCVQNKLSSKQFSMVLDLNLSLTKHNNGNVRTRTLSCSLLPTLQGNPKNYCSRRFQYCCTSLAALAVYIWYKLECFDYSLYYLSVDSLSHLHAAMRDGHSAVVLEHGDRGVVVSVRVQWEFQRHQADSPLLPNICLEKESVLFF